MTASIRQATSEDRDATHAIVFTDPEPEILRICQSLENTRRVGRVLIEQGIHAPAERTLMLEEDGAAVALTELWYPGQSLSLTPLLMAKVLARGARIGGPGLVLRYARYSRIRGEVDTPHPPDSLYIAHLNTHPEQRGRGLGLQLLEHIEGLARGRGLPEISLDVYIGNPARRLYERFGFEVTVEKRSPAFEKVTGLPGYAAMVKDLR